MSHNERSTNAGSVHEAETLLVDSAHTDVRGLQDLKPRPEADAVARGQLLASLEGRLFKRGGRPLRFSRYVLKEQIGMGALGVVYRAEDPELLRTVAIKFLRSDAPRSSATMARRGIAREARALGRLNHPNIVPIFDVGTYTSQDLRLVETEYEGGLFLVMEFIEGQTLRRWLDEKPRSVREILDVYIEAGRGLAAAHTVGVVHRDFKPDNVIVGADGRVRVVDFGLAGWQDRTDASSAFDTLDTDLSGELAFSAVPVQERTIVTDGVVGTPAYMAPEQHRGGPTEPAVDQFAFCVALYEALCGERPFHADSLDGLMLSKTRPLRTIPVSRGPVDKSVRAAIRRGLSPRPEQRFPHMNTLLQVLEQRRTVRRRRSMRAAALGMVASGLLGGAAWLDARRDAAVCEAAGASIYDVWSPEIADRVSERFWATNLPYAERTELRVRAELDAYAESWADMRTSLCRPDAETDLEPAEIDGRLACLDQRRTEFETTIELLLEIDADGVERSPVTVSRLRSPEQCHAPDPHRPPDEIAAEVALARQRLARVQVLDDAGDYDEAVLIVEEVVATANELGYTPLLAETLLRRAAVQKHRGNLEAARAAGERAFFLAQSEGLDEIALKAAIELVYVVGDLLAHPDEGMQWATHAEAILSRYAADPRLPAALSHAEALVAARRGDFAEALELSRETLSTWEALTEPDNPQLVVIHGEIGSALYNMGRYREAQQSYERALELAEQRFGPEHPITADTLNNLALAHRKQDRFEQALALAQRSLEIREKALGKNHQRVAMSLHNLGELANSLEDQELAAAYYERALDGWRISVGNDHPSLGATLNNLGRVRWAQGRDNDALAHYEEAMSIWQRTLGEEHPYVAVAHCNIGFVYLKQGQPELGRSHFEICVRIREAKKVAPGDLSEARFGWAQSLWPSKPRVAVEQAVRARAELLAAEGSDEQALGELNRWLEERR